MTATYPPPDAAAPEPEPDTSILGPPGKIRQTYRKVPGWIPAIAVGGLALGSCIYVAIVDPNTQQTIFPACTFKQITGLDCPGCGMTRAMHSLMTADPIGALDHNIFIALIFPLAAYLYVKWLLRVTVGYELPRIKLNPKIGFILAPLVLTFWVVRNLPWGPFPWLAATAS